MQIVLMRHGKPKIDKTSWLTAKDFGEWIDRYNASGIDPDLPPPQAAIEQAGVCAYVVCSDLPRSIESALALGIDNINLADPLFREFELPHTRWRFPSLPVPVWLLLFRLAWVFGYSGGRASLKEERGRACRCAQRLIDLANKHEDVLFVGHGLLNRLIARQLERMGWACVDKPTATYWSMAVDRREPNKALVSAPRNPGPH